MRKMSVCALCLAVLVSSVSHSQTSGYFLDRMPTVNGALKFTPAGITDNGQIGGTADTGPVMLADIIKNGIVETMQGLGVNDAPVNNDLTMTGISDSGGATGSGIAEWGYSTAIYWDPQGRPWELVGPEWNKDNDPSANGSDTNTTDVNNDGTSVGSALNANNTVAMMWRGGAGNEPIQLESAFYTDYLAASSESANAISRNGEMVAGAGTVSVYITECGLLVPMSECRFPDYAEMWKSGRLVMSQAYAHGYGINDSGTMVGDVGVGPDTCANDPNNLTGFECLTYVAMMWGPNAVKLDLLPGANTSVANAINDSNIVVGSAGGHGVKWDPEGRVTDLNKLMEAQIQKNLIITNALKITDGGRILVTAFNGQETIYYQLTPAISNTIKITSNINPASFGQPIHLVASIIPSKTAPVPQGNVQWYDNGKLLGTSGLTSIGTASWEPSTWVPGVHKITVSYNGYSPNASGASAIFNQTVHETSTKTVLTASETSVVHGRTVKLTATVSSAYGAIVGTVTFKNRDAVLGTAEVNARTKQATLSPTLKSAGKYSITATYGSSAAFSASTSTVVMVTAR